MSRFSQVQEITTEVAGGSTLDFSLDITSATVDIYSIYVAPSTGTGTSDLTIYSNDARTNDDICYKASGFIALIDPCYNDDETISQCSGFVFRYSQPDGIPKLYLTITNNDTSARTYNITLNYADTPFTSAALVTPQWITVSAYSSGEDIFSDARCLINNGELSSAEFRAKLIPPGDNYPAYVDLRTASEGGTFAHNGTTQLVITDLAANQNGSCYRWTSSGYGRWYYAWRLSNSSGWSKWSDGNDSPSEVRHYIDISEVADTGPPEDWQVTCEPGPRANSVIVRATRPQTNGNVIRAFAVQIRDSDGTWYDLDADSGPAETHYDGSGEDHILDPSTGTISNGSQTWGTAAVGDVVLMDVRGDQSWDLDHCITAIVKSVSTTISTYDIIRPLPSAHTTDGKYDQIRLKIVRAPWHWDSDGYFGGWRHNGGYWDPSMSQCQVYNFPDKSTEEFASDPIDYDPSASGIVARVWFLNGYSISTGGIVSSEQYGGPYIRSNGAIWTSFSSRDWWVPSLQLSDHIEMEYLSNGKVKISMNGAGTNDEVGVAGLVGNHLTFPDSSGIIKVRAKFDDVVLKYRTLTIDGSGIGLYLGTYGPLTTISGNLQGMRVFVCQRIKSGNSLRFAIGYVGPKLRPPVPDLSAYPTSYPWYADETVDEDETSIEMKITIELDSTTMSAPAVVDKLFEYKIGSGSWKSLPLGSGDESFPTVRMADAIRGYRCCLVGFSESALDGDTMTISEYEIINGIMVKS